MFPSICRVHLPSISPIATSRPPASPLRSTLGAKGGRPSPRVSPTLTTVANKLVMLGGAAHEKALNDVRVYEVDSGQVRSPPELPLIGALISP